MAGHEASKLMIKKSHEVNFIVETWVELHEIVCILVNLADKLSFVVMILKFESVF
jgi:hypothetical protein